MTQHDQDFPDWLIEQRGRRYRGDGEAAPKAGWQDRSTLVRNYARHLAETGRPVTIEAIREMLRFVDRGYSLAADQISRALAPLYRSDRIGRYANGSRVLVDGCAYRSIRAAAAAEGVSPQTVLNRIASSAEAWRGWTRDESSNAVLVTVPAERRDV